MVGPERVRVDRAAEVGRVVLDLDPRRGVPLLESPIELEELLLGVYLAISRKPPSTSSDLHMAMTKLGLPTSASRREQSSRKIFLLQIKTTSEGWSAPQSAPTRARRLATGVFSRTR